MSPVIVVVTDVFIHQSVQMAFVEYDDIIEQISPAVSDPAFCYAVLPRASEAAPLWLDAETLHRADDFLIEFAARSRSNSWVSSRKGMLLATAARSKHCSDAW